VKHNLEQLATAIIRQFGFKAYRERTFELNQPHKVTVELKSGQFKKIAYIGGEQLVAIGAYVGKRNSIIFKFQNATTGEKVEFSHTDAERYLKGFQDYLDVLVRPDYPSFEVAHREAARVSRGAKAAATVEEIKKEAVVKGQAWGSW
jgi:hypothetical protein